MYEKVLVPSLGPWEPLKFLGGELQLQTLLEAQSKKAKGKKQKAIKQKVKKQQAQALTCHPAKAHRRN